VNNKRRLLLLLLLVILVVVVVMPWCCLVLLWVWVAYRNRDVTPGVYLQVASVPAPVLALSTTNAATAAAVLCHVHCKLCTMAAAELAAAAALAAVASLTAGLFTTSQPGFRRKHRTTYDI
jgi:hypothetical protein